MSNAEQELRSYFQHSSAGVEVVADGLKEMCFGEYLIEEQALSRTELFSALQLQVKNPGVRLGECIAALGIMPYPTVEDHIQQWLGAPVVEVNA